MTLQTGQARTQNDLTKYYQQAEADWQKTACQPAPSPGRDEAEPVSGYLLHDRGAATRSAVFFARFSGPVGEIAPGALGSRVIRSLGPLDHGQQRLRSPEI